jgi:16S rRNA C967 or C1407 C5-methylase (RsmB/RsmF family)
MPTDLPAHLARYLPLVDDAAAFTEALRAPLPQTIATNIVRLDADALRHAVSDHLSLTPVSWFPGAFRLANEDRPGRHWSHSAGLYSVMEEASLLPVAMLDVRPGQRVLDLCAAPGNKTAQLAMRLGNRGTLIANDIKVGRLVAVHEQLRRLGLVNVTTTGHDGAVYPVDDGQFDRVLVDAPCTAEGKARRGFVRDSSPQFRAWITGQQRALLVRAAALLKPGGRLVYSTCTFAPEENEGVVSAVLAATEGRLRVVDAGIRPPGADDGLAGAEGATFDATLRHARRLWPHRTDTGGFFAVALERVDDGPAPDFAAAPLPEAASSDAVDAYLQRFALPPAATAPLYFFHDTRHLRAVAADHVLPAGVAVENVGIDFARRRSTHPKPTTAAAMALGDVAGANRIALDDDELERWRERAELDLPPARLAACERGYQLVVGKGFVQGTGFLRVDEDGSGQLESHFPKAWMRFRPEN